MFKNRMIKGNQKRMITKIRNEWLKYNQNRIITLPYKMVKSLRKEYLHVLLLI